MEVGHHVLVRLPGQPYHIPAADGVAQLQKRLHTIQAAPQGVPGLQVPVERGVGGFELEHVSAGTRLVELAVLGFGEIPATEYHREVRLLTLELVHTLREMAHKIRCVVLTGLQQQNATTLLINEIREPQQSLVANGVLFLLRLEPHIAVLAPLLADVGHFDDTADLHLLAGEMLTAPTAGEREHLCLLRVSAS